MRVILRFGANKVDYMKKAYTLQPITGKQEVHAMKISATKWYYSKLEFAKQVSGNDETLINSIMDKLNEAEERTREETLNHTLIVIIICLTISLAVLGMG